MPIGRRDLFLHSAAAVALMSGPARSEPLHQTGALESDHSADQTARLQAAIDATAAAGRVLHLGPGQFTCGTLGLPAGARLSGIAGSTRLTFRGGAAFVVASRADSISLQGLVIDGHGQPLDGATADGLVTFADCRNLMLHQVTVSGGLLNGISLRRCSGTIIDCTIVDCGGTAVFSQDATGLAITGNRIERIGNNGIQVWRNAAGEDGTLVAHNRISHIEARAGGNGPNGNGINVFRAGSVQVQGNRVTDCAFSGIRCNAASNVLVTGNSCERMGEVALYAEFAFAGVVFANNLVDHAALGISVTNFNEGGRLAVVQGNLLRNLHGLSAEGDVLGVGIAVEADASVTGNVIENAQRAGIVAGTGPFRRDIVVTGNVVRGTPLGIGVSSDEAGGSVLVAQNLVSGAADGGIRQVTDAGPFGPDLARDTTGPAWLSLSGNVSV
jgi:uncharacterized secreted repeat protein (TIGR03808 family)